MTTFDTPQPISATLEIIGSARVSASDRADTVVTVRPANPSKPAEVRAAEDTRVEFGDGRLLVKTPSYRKILGPSWAVDVSVELPTGSQLEVTSALGDVHADGELGACRIKTSMGAIHLDQTGPLRAVTGYGAVAVDRVVGDAEVTTGSGDVRLGEVAGTATVKNSNGDTDIGRVAGELRVKAANGRVEIGRAEGAVTAKTANGSVAVGEVRRGAVVLETAAGGIEVGVRDGVAAWLDVNTRFGTVRNGLNAADGPGASDGTVEVRARTSVGDIVIHRAAVDSSAGSR